MSFRMIKGLLKKPMTVVLVLALASAMANAGGALLSASLPLIKAEFGYTDTELGLLTGYASAVTFALLTFPIASWAARWGNSRVFGVCLIVYSAANAMTAACSSLWQFMAARFVTGLGPASEFPLGQAIISDHYPPHRRSGALAIYSIGYKAGVSGGLAIGGWLAMQIGWRQAFLVFGACGVLIAFLQMAIARDVVQPTKPAPADGDGLAQSARPTSPWTAVRDLLANPVYTHITLGYGWASFATFGLVQWMPSFYNREFGLTPSEAGVFFGGAYATGALMGLLAGGALGNRMAQAGSARLLAFCTVSFSLTFPLVALVLFAPSLQVAFAAHMMATFVGALPNGPVLAMIHNELPRDRRVMGASVFLLTLTLLGAGGGPLLIGVISDTLAATHGAGGLKWAMLAVKLLGVLLFFHLGYAWWKLRQAARQAQVPQEAQVTLAAKTP